MIDHVLRLFDLLRWPLVVVALSYWLLQTLDALISSRRKIAEQMREYKKQLDEIHHQIEVTHHVTERLEAAERQVKVLTDRLTIVDNRTAGARATSPYTGR